VSESAAAARARPVPLWRWALNSFIYAGLGTLGLLVSSIPVAYAFSRLRWRGRDAVFLIVLVARANPAMLIDPYGALIKDLCLIACAFTVWTLSPWRGLKRLRTA
jgi:ABC-type glycerol-3-phosphate transport system permease component